MSTTGTDLILPGEITPTALELPADLSEQAWLAAGETLGLATRACQWWVGDWLNYGESAGYIARDRYDAAEAAVPHLGRKTLSSYAEVARKCPIRMGDLSFAHHQVIAAFVLVRKADQLAFDKVFGPVPA